MRYTVLASRCRAHFGCPSTRDWMSHLCDSRLANLSRRGANVLASKFEHPPFRYRLLNLPKFQTCESALFGLSGALQGQRPRRLLDCLSDSFGDSAQWARETLVLHSPRFPSLRSIWMHVLSLVVGIARPISLVI